MEPQLDDDALATWQAFLTAHDRVTRTIGRDLARSNLPDLGWYDVLWVLYRVPERRLRTNQLADEVVLSRTGLVRLVDRIEAGGLVHREAVPGDRRGSYVTLTDAGVEMLRRMWPVYARGIAEHFAGQLGSAGPRLRRVLQRVAQSAGA